MYWIVTDLNLIVTIWFTLVMEDGVQAQKAQGCGLRGVDVTPVKVCCCRGLAFWGKKHRPAPRQRKWHDMYLKGNLDKVMCVQSYNIKLCHIERGHIFMIHRQTILQIVKCPVQLRGKCLCLERHRHVVVYSIQQRCQQYFPKIMKCWCCILYY